MECRTNSKKHCMACEHYDYCDKANKCNGNCHICDDYDCENNPKHTEKYRVDKKKIEFNELYSLCNREQFFTCGDNKQYQKMFDIAKDGITQTELTYILYICSKQSLDYISDKVTPLFNKEDN